MPITVSGTSITFNDATTQSTAGITSAVTSLNGQTGAITNTTLGNIGFVGLFAYVGTSNVTGGNTVDGTNLRYISTITSNTINGVYSEGSNTVQTRTHWIGINIIRYNSGNTGWQTPGGTTALSGTWRACWCAPARVSSYDGCNNETQSESRVVVFVRVS